MCFHDCSAFFKSIHLGWVEVLEEKFHIFWFQTINFECDTALPVSHHSKCSHCTARYLC